MTVLLQDKSVLAILFVVSGLPTSKWGIVVISFYTSFTARHILKALSATVAVTERWVLLKSTLYKKISFLYKERYMNLYRYQFRQLSWLVLSPVISVHRSLEVWCLTSSPYQLLYFRITYISKIQLVVYYQCCVLIGWATTRLYVIAH